MFLFINFKFYSNKIEYKEDDRQYRSKDKATKILILCPQIINYFSLNFTKKTLIVEQKKKPYIQINFMPSLRFKNY